MNLLDGMLLELGFELLEDAMLVEQLVRYLVLSVVLQEPILVCSNVLDVVDLVISFTLRHQRIVIE